MNKFERMIKNAFGPSPVIGDSPQIQRELDAEHYRQSRSSPWRHEIKGVYAPRTLQEAGL